MTISMLHKLSHEPLVQEAEISCCKIVLTTEPLQSYQPGREEAYEKQRRVLRGHQYACSRNDLDAICLIENIPDLVSSHCT